MTLILKLIASVRMWSPGVFSGTLLVQGSVCAYLPDCVMALVMGNICLILLHCLFEITARALRYGGLDRNSVFSYPLPGDMCCLTQYF